MKFIADFHVHSRFSRATAKNLDLENLYIAAQLKGITVIGTGDFTHPGWFSEIKEKLVPAEPGLFKLKKEISAVCDQEVPTTCRRDVRFMLVSEISNIYKKNNKTRKNHNLVFLSDLDKAENFNLRLDKIGNIKSDGRPILGLDARNLLEILLETSDGGFLIPAHIWTPWFSLLGSKSGFDSLEECFEDLTDYIFAAETGLSSDPSMNWRVSGLDGLTLVSNSDAHSPMKLGREANIFDTDLSYTAIRSAMESGDPEKFLGTFEFYPEEGKYHIDGHRKCNVRSWPKQTRKQGGICPICEKPLTLGVLYRVEELSDRKEGEKPDGHHPFFNTIPLVEILSEVLKVGPASKKVTGTYRSLIEKLGPEFDILTTLKKEILDDAGIPLLGEAISRVRRSEIDIIPGFDGEFGKIKIFGQDERNRLLGQKSLFIASPLQPPLGKKKRGGKTSKQYTPRNVSKDSTPEKITGQKFKPGELNQKQKQVVAHKSGPLMVVAGPGTGKTRTLTQRIAHLIKNKRVLPEHIVAVTFTNKAAQEMRQRLELLLDRPKQDPFIGTFHGFCFELLNNYEEKTRYLIDEHDQISLISDAIQHVEGTGIPVNIKPKKLLDGIVRAKQRILKPDECGDEFPRVFLSVYTTYQNLLEIERLYDYEDLIFNAVRILETDHRFCETCRDLFRFIFVDEYQDLNYGQYRLIKALVPPGSNRNICVIGDPDQSIYGFRGSNVKYFKRFVKDYPGAEVVKLTKNYRSTQTILDASYQVIEPQKKDGFKERIYSEIHGEKTIRVIDTYSEKSEAVAVGKTIEQLIGGMGFHSFDFDRVDQHPKTSNIGFSDVAVLYRTSEQHKIISKVFDAAGIPYQIVSRKNLFDKTGITKLISLLKIVEASGCYLDFERILNITEPTIGKQSAEIFKKWCYQNSFSLKTGLINARRFPIDGMGKIRQKRLNEFLDNILEMKQKTAAMSMEEKLFFLLENTRLSKIFNKGPKEKEALKHLMDIFKNLGINKKGVWSMAAFGSDTDTYSHRSEKVALMTMHAAKGLEFPVVFVTGCEKGFLPFQRPGTKESPPDIEEERRLFYVAMTRAKQRLYLTFAKKRRIFGKTEKRELSPFVSKIEAHLLAHEAPVPGKKKKSGPSQLKLF